MVKESRIKHVLPRVVAHLAQGKTKRAIATILDVSPTTIYDWRRAKPSGFRNNPEDEVIPLVEKVFSQLSNTVAGQPLALEFLTAACTLDWPRETLEGVVKAYDTRSKLSEHDPADWLKLGITLGILNTAQMHDEAYELSTRFWRPENKIGKSAWYLIREQTLYARQRLSSDAVLAAVQGLGAGLNLREPSGTWECFTINRTAEVSQLKSGAFSDMQYVPGTGDRFAHSPSVDTQFRSSSSSQISISREGSPYHFREEWREFGWLALNRALSEKGDVFESHKARFASGFLDALSGDMCRIQRTTYLSSLLTAAGMKWRFKDATSGRILGLPTDEAITFSNHLGGGALVVTSDRMLVAIQQSAGNQESPGLLIPLSGSMDFEDVEIELQRPEPTLKGLFERSMAREVREEAKLSNEKTRHAVLGVAIDLARGIKADYYGVSYIDLPWSELSKRREPIYGGPFREGPLNLESETEFQNSIDATIALWRSQDSPWLMAILTLVRTAFREVRTLVEVS